MNRSKSARQRAAAVSKSALLYAACFLSTPLPGYAADIFTVGAPGTKGADATAPGGNGEPGTDGKPGNASVNNSDAANFASTNGGIGGNGGAGADNPSGAGGSGGDAGNGGDATASVQTTAPAGDVTQTVEAHGGEGGSGGSAGSGHPGGGRGGKGGKGGDGKVFAIVLNAGNFNIVVDANSHGGPGGFGPPGGGGGGEPNGDAGAAGAAGSAFTSAVINDITAGNRTLKLTAIGGNGLAGYNGGGGGSATINVNVTTAANIIAIINGTGGNGGGPSTGPISTAPAGGDADYTGTFLSTAGNISTTATLIGGNPQEAADGGAVSFIDTVTTNHGGYTLNATLQSFAKTSGGGVQVNGLYRIAGPLSINIGATLGPSTDKLVGTTGITLDAIAAGTMNVNASTGSSGASSIGAVLTSSSNAVVTLSSVATRGQSTLGANINSNASITVNQAIASSSTDVATASTDLRAVGDITALTQAIAGTPADVDAQTAANGSIPRLSTTAFSSGSTGIVQNFGSARGGNGGFHADHAGNGANVFLTNAVSGFSPNWVSVSQNAIGGDGGSTEIGTPGAPGAADSALGFDDTTARNRYILTASATGGQGGSVNTNGFGRKGGNGTAFVNSGSVAEIQQYTANAFGGRGGSSAGPGNFGGAGGDALATAVGTSTSTSPIDMTVSGRAVGGEGGFADQIGRYGLGGNASSSSKATFLSNSGTVADSALGGKGSSAGIASSTATGIAESLNAHDLTVSSFAATNPLIPALDSFATAKAEAISAGTQAILTVTANAVTGPYGAATAQVGALGASGTYSFAAQMGSVVSKGSGPIGSTITGRARTRNGTAAPDLSDTAGLTTFIYLTTNPLNSDSVSAFHDSPNAHHNFDIGGASNPLGLISLLTGYPTDGSGKAEEFAMSITDPIDLSTLSQSQHLMLALLDPTVTGSFDELRITISAGSLFSTSHSFTTAAELTSFFSDQTLDLGDLSGLSGILDFKIDTFFDSHTPGSSFSTSMFLGNTTPGSGPAVPEPSSFLLVLAPLCLLNSRRRRGNNPAPTTATQKSCAEP